MGLIGVREVSVSTWLWVSFLLVVAGALALDLAIFHRRPRAPSLREAGLWTVGWVGFAALVAGAVFVTKGGAAGLEFVTGYLIEWTLSMDNVFVFAALFSLFAVPAAYQRRVLFWGILGAAVMRLLFILMGVALLERFHWMIYVFGGVLVVAAVRMMTQGDKPVATTRNPLVAFVSRFLPVTDAYHEQRFFVRVSGRLMATPLFLVLLTVEATDVVFAVDSVPAILAITRDTFIVYSSNLCAILGLRALYFLLGGLMGAFRYLHIGLAAILLFVGVKMLLSADDVYHISTGATLAVVFVILGLAMGVSVLVRAPAPVSPPGPSHPRDEG